jgi:hypothetical protein
MAKREEKQIFVVLKGFVGLPDQDDNVEDVHPWETVKSGKNAGKPKRDAQNELVWEYTEYEAKLSEVGHMVNTGKLILKSEFKDFHPDLYEKAKAAGHFSKKDDGDDGEENPDE